MRRGGWWLGGMVCSALWVLGACVGGGAGAPDGGTLDSGLSQAVITIQNFTFSPENLDVFPGQTVTVRNLDTAAHTVTSQAAPGQYTPGSVAGVAFDTGALGAGVEATFTIPTFAPRGTVVPYFCDVHKSGMRNSGQLTVR